MDKWHLHTFWLRVWKTLYAYLNISFPGDFAFYKSIIMKHICVWINFSSFIKDSISTSDSNFSKKIRLTTLLWATVRFLFRLDGQVAVHMDTWGIIHVDNNERFFGEFVSYLINNSTIFLTFQLDIICVKLPVYIIINSYSQKVYVS